MQKIPANVTGQDFLTHFRKEKHYVCNREFTSELQDKYPQLQKYSIAELKRLIREFNRGLGDYIIENRDGVELPNFLGHMFVGSCKQRMQMPEYLIENHKDKTPMYRNADGHYPYVFFVTRNYANRFAMGKFWGFKVDRNFQERVAKNFPNNWKRYLDTSSYYPTSPAYKKDKVKTKVKEMYRYSDFHYREFDL